MRSYSPREESRGTPYIVKSLSGLLIIFLNHYDTPTKSSSLKGASKAPLSLINDIIWCITSEYNYEDLIWIKSKGYCIRIRHTI